MKTMLDNTTDGERSRGCLIYSHLLQPVLQPPCEFTRFCGVICFHFSVWLCAPFQKRSFLKFVFAVGTVRQPDANFGEEHTSFLRCKPHTAQPANRGGPGSHQQFLRGGRQHRPAAAHPDSKWDNLDNLVWNSFDTHFFFWSKSTVGSPFYLVVHKAKPISACSTLQLSKLSKL